MTLELTYNADDKDQIEFLNTFMRKWFDQSCEDGDEYDRLVDLTETLAPFVKVTGVGVWGCGEELYETEDGKLFYFHSDSDLLQLSTSPAWTKEIIIESLQAFLNSAD